MEMQLVGVYGLIVVAVVAIARRTYRTWFVNSTSGCGSGCGKCAADVAEPPPQRRRALPFAK